MIPSLLTVAIIPFGSQLGAQKMVIADLNVGILYTFGIVSLGVYGIVLAGYAANSKYPFLGGIRSSAQMISYEIAMGMSVIPLFLIACGLDVQQLSAAWQEFLEGTSSLNLGPAGRLAGHAWLAHLLRTALVCHFPGGDVCRNQPHAVRPARSRSRNWPAATTSNTAR